MAGFGFRRSCDFKVSFDLFIILVLPLIYFGILHDSFEYGLQFSSVYPFNVDIDKVLEQI